MSTIAERLVQLRHAANKTQKDVAEELGIAASGLRTYEKGQRVPYVEHMIRLADYYNVSIEYILGRTDDPTPPVPRAVPDTPDTPDE